MAERERWEVGHTAEINLPHQMGNYFCTIVLYCTVANGTWRGQRFWMSLSHFPEYTYIYTFFYAPSNILDFFHSLCLSLFHRPLSLCHFHLYVFCFISLFPAPYLLPPSVWQSLSLAHSVSQGSASQMSPLVTTSVIDLRTDTGTDLKQSCS